MIKSMFKSIGKIVFVLFYLTLNFGKDEAEMLPKPKQTSDEHWTVGCRDLIIVIVVVFSILSLITLCRM